MKGLPEKMKGEMLRGKECREEFDRCWTTAQNQPKAMAEYHFLWTRTKEDLPKNLAAFPPSTPAAAADSG